MKVVLLAGGKGTRMKLGIPKVMVDLGGKSLIQHSLDNVKNSGLDSKPIVVVGYKADLVKDHLKDYNVDFVVQEEQNGTGHALMQCEKIIDKNEDVLVLYGDHALIKPETLVALKDEYLQSPDCKIAMITYSVQDFSMYGSVFNHYGRILRDESGEVMAIREAKDASAEELQMTEVNPAYYLFNGEWLWKNLSNISNNNSQKEYYLTDLIELAISQKLQVKAVQGQHIDEAIGVNTPEQLECALKTLKSNN